MTTIDELKEAIAKNPSDVGLRLCFSDFLAENPETWREKEKECTHPTAATLPSGGNKWRHETWCICKGIGRIDLSALPPHQQPPWIQQRYVMALRWLDERGHGTKECDVCHGNRIDIDRRCEWLKDIECGRCSGDGSISTFSDLLDRPGDGPCEECGGDGRKRLGSWSDCPTCSGTGKQVILGTLTTLVQELRYGGDPLGEELAGLWVKEVGPYGGTLAWMVLPNPIPGIYYSRLDALRELHRRVWLAMVEECLVIDRWGRNVPCAKGCKKCNSLEWKVRIG